MKSRRRILTFWLFVSLLHSNLVYSTQTINIEIADQSVRYVERLDGKIFVREQGGANRVSIQYEAALSQHWQLALQSQVASGNLDYYGQTLLGTPLKSTTDHQYGSFSSQIFFRHSTAIFDIFPYLQISPHYWSRKVLSTENTAGVEIARRWWELDTGIILQKTLQRNWSIQLETYYGRSIQGTVTFDYTALGFPKKSADSNQGEFFLAGLHVEKQFRSLWRLTTGYRMHRSRWDKSDPVSFDTPTTLSLFEPSNELKSAELFIGIGRHLN